MRALFLLYYYDYYHYYDQVLMTLNDAPGHSVICLFAQRRMGAVDVALEV